MSKEYEPLMAVVGIGYWGKNLLREFQSTGRVKSFFDENPELSARAAAQYPGLRRAASLEEILTDPDIRAVAVATPAATHFELGLKVLEAGKHLFMEKPLALSSGQGRRLAELAGQNGLILMVDHLMLRHPAYLEMRRLAETGALGRILHINSRRMNFGKIRQEEDVVWSMAPHDLAMIMGLMGRPPQSLSAQGNAWVTPGLADAAEIHLDFGAGADAQISVSWFYPLKERRLVVIGDKKMAVFDDLEPWPTKLKLYDHRVNWAGQRPVAEPADPQAVDLEMVEPLKTKCLDFIKALDKTSRPPDDAAESLAVLGALEGLTRSMRNNGRLEAPGETEDFFIHPTSQVDPGALVGKGSKIWHFSHIMEGSELGENCNIGQNVVIGPRVKIGRGVKVQNNVSVYEGVTLEDDVFCGPSMVFTNVFNPRADIVRKSEYRPTVVRRGASLGANATVVCGHTLGAWCFVGAGAVVTKDVPDYALVVGNPARPAGWVCRCGGKLPSDLICPACGRAYLLDKGLLSLKEPIDD